MASVPSSSAPKPSNTAAAESHRDLLKQIRSHEIAIAELNSLSSSRGVYQRNGNILFRTTIQKAIASEQKQLDIAKVKVQQLSD
ncbi:uncharacterized protein LOC113761765 isoform X2 [Coffea eugenioides]|uniref:uncharacterized protein LOC113761765 isoform X2 n=1 Tax=Coffea eugenioides TaxID=49369 RepID=UPI000F61345D|nr:uncharacterized protein LOC113761765 isoform X2 [Coffea eugenioides]